jgi:type VI secretion system secreted protein Hcp
MFVAVFTACSLTASSFAESFNLYLRIGDASTVLVKGESQADGHADEIEVASFKSGVLQKGQQFAGGSGAGVGKSEFTPLTIYKFLDKASAPLFVACATGQRFPKATLFLVNTGSELGAQALPPVRPQGTFFRIELEDVFVTSLNHDANTTDSFGNLVETVTLSYTRIRWFYTPVDPQTGQPGPEVKGGFDVKANKKL